MNNYIFSVIIPLYNRERFVRKSVESVLNQSYRNFELIIVDDCSTDNSFEIVKSYNDTRLKIFRLNRNSGPAFARNFGVEKSNGSLISFLDSDDYLENNFLKITLEKVLKSKQSVGFWYTGVIYHSKNKQYNFFWKAKKYNSPYLTLLKQIRIGSGAGVTIRKDAFKKINGFNVNLPAAEDTDFFLRISQIADFEGIENNLVNIRKDGKDRLSKNYEKIAKAYNIFIPDHIDVINQDSSLKIKFYYKLMWLNFHLKDKEKAFYWYSFLKRDKILNFKIIFIYTLYKFVPLRLSKKIHRFVSKLFLRRNL